MRILSSDFPKNRCEYWASANTYVGTSVIANDNGTFRISNGKWYRDELIAELGDPSFIIMGPLSNLSINETSRSEALAYWTITVFEFRIDGPNVGGNTDGYTFLQFYSTESNSDTYGVREYTYVKSAGTLVDYVTSISSSAYPDNGVSGSYWYKKR